MLVKGATGSKRDYGGMLHDGSQFWGAMRIGGMYLRSYNITKQYSFALFCFIRLPIVEDSYGMKDMNQYQTTTKHESVNHEHNSVSECTLECTANSNTIKVKKETKTCTFVPVHSSVIEIYSYAFLVMTSFVQGIVWDLKPWVLCA